MAAPSSASSAVGLLLDTKRRCARPAPRHHCARCSANLQEVMARFPDVLKSEMVYFDSDPQQVEWMRVHGIDSAFPLDPRTGFTADDLIRAGL